jgi:hypothetical protein
MYTLWIGTNDVGVNSLLVGQGTPGVSLVNSTECAINWLKVLYESGARNFLFQNVSFRIVRELIVTYQILKMLPLHEVPLYSANSYPNRYWTAQRNTTEWSVFMREMVNTGNALSRALLQLLAPTLKGAHIGKLGFISTTTKMPLILKASIGYFDSYGLFSDMIAHPQNYLNGTAPLNVTGSAQACVFQLNESTSDTGNCKDATGAAADSFLW